MKDKISRLQKIRTVLEKEMNQFPEAMCDCATRLIYEELPYICIMNGTFRGHPHIWAYDMKDKCHIDITLDQFNTEYEVFKPITILAKGSAEKLGYKLGSISEWEFLFESDFFSLNKKISSKKTLQTILRSMRPKTRSRFRFW